MRHRRDDATGFTASFEAPAADLAEQHQPSDPIETAHDAERGAVTSPFEADAVDAAEQAEPVAMDDELRAEAVSDLPNTPADFE